MQWFRMYAEFASDAKVQMMDEKYQRRLVMLFCLRCNVTSPLPVTEEALHVTFTDEEVSFQLRIGMEEWIKTKRVFVEKGFIDESNCVLNWDKRNMRSDSSLERVRRYREKKKKESNSVNKNDNESVTLQKRKSNALDKNRIDSKKRLDKSNPKKVFVLPDWIDSQDWKDFVEMRNRVRKPLTDRAKQLAVMDLEKLKDEGESISDVIKQSIKNSWQGFFRVKKDYQISSITDNELRKKKQIEAMESGFKNRS